MQKDSKEEKKDKDIKRELIQEVFLEEYKKSQIFKIIFWIVLVATFFLLIFKIFTFNLTDIIVIFLAILIVLLYRRVNEIEKKIDKK